MPEFQRVFLSRASGFLFAAALTISSVFALDPGKTLTQYSHRVWGQEEGLFQPTIYSILQTRDGFIWLGTQDSLIRFDGVHFREFNNGNAFFERSLIRALVEDTRGNLWVASVGSGIARIDLKGSVTRYTEQNGLPSSNAFCLDSDSRGAVWICTDRGLARLTNGYIRIFNQAEGLPGNQVRASCEAVDGTRWVAGIDFGLSRWSGAHFEAYSDTVVRPGEKFSALLCAHDGSIWAGGSGLVHITGTGSRRLTTRDGLPDNQISSLAESSDGAL
ncbi:MAG: hypothetical protein JO270_01685, partial [Acidobacteriaceae bacterium]|nr:hypothetical protein [Acidobacteriaceae bacterium]